MKKRKIKPYTTFKALKAKWMKDPEFAKGYHELDFEFAIKRAILDQRIKNGLTQKQLAEKVGTKQSAISRFEGGESNPRLNFLKKLVKALGLKLTATAI